MRCFALIFLAFLVSVSGRFTDDFYKHLAGNNTSENLIFSPLSVEIALGMVYMGAEGRTAQEMRNTLKLSEDKKEVARKYKKLLSNLEGREKVAILKLANRIYVADSYRLVPEYNQAVKDSFKAQAETISLKSPESASLTVNKWVTDQTNGKIKDLVTPADFKGDLVAMLLNAIYFKGQWEHKFNPKHTKVTDFYITDQKRVPVQMMKVSGVFQAAYVRSLDAQVIYLPYQNSSLYMVVFLPKKNDGLTELEKKIADYSEPIPPREVNLKLPKFKIEFTAELKDILRTMGIRDAFSGNANLKSLVNGQVNIDKVRQKAFIEVNEEGAEAAAATVAILTSKRATRPLEFVVNHPFAYVIRDNENIYFQGHVVNPAAKDK
ncbi:serine protease inhibitor 42Dd-like [Drosophila takahashii]|uniref:serine protease inhibitor 42Dd-like n=1 Tax=Drosophila takahashii TaxID=29030 RepID=UPI001CF7F236|nr:serine protease inhibitor 42Dd-like [Drosophila takahashii]